VCDRLLHQILRGIKLRVWYLCEAGTVGFRQIRTTIIDILPALKREDSHGMAPLGWDVYS